MALIKCPDCGREVSSSAVACPQCGYPISSHKTDGTVYLKLSVKGTIGKTNVIEVATGKILWQGYQGSVATFHVEKPTEVYIGWGLSKNTGCKETKFCAEAGKKYELTLEQGFLTAHFIVKEVDVIDASY